MDGRPQENEGHESHEEPISGSSPPGALLEGLESAESSAIDSIPTASSAPTRGFHYSMVKLKYFDSLGMRRPPPPPTAAASSSSSSSSSSVTRTHSHDQSTPNGGGATLHPAVANKPRSTTAPTSAPLHMPATISSGFGSPGVINRSRAHASPATVSNLRMAELSRSRSASNPILIAAPRNGSTSAYATDDKEDEIAPAMSLHPRAAVATNGPMLLDKAFQFDEEVDESVFASGTTAPSRMDTSRWKKRSDDSFMFPAPDEDDELADHNEPSNFQEYFQMKNGGNRTNNDLVDAEAASFQVGTAQAVAEWKKQQRNLRVF